MSVSFWFFTKNAFISSYHKAPGLVEKGGSAIFSLLGALYELGPSSLANDTLILSQDNSLDCSACTWLHNPFECQKLNSTAGFLFGFYLQYVLLFLEVYGFLGRLGEGHLFFKASEEIALNLSKT